MSWISELERVHIVIPCHLHVVCKTVGWESECCSASIHFLFYWWVIEAFNLLQIDSIPRCTFIKERPLILVRQFPQFQLPFLQLYMYMYIANSVKAVIMWILQSNVSLGCAVAGVNAASRTEKTYSNMRLCMHGVSEKLQATRIFMSKNSVWILIIPHKKQAG